MEDFAHTAVVTGGSSGIGRAVVERLLHDGFRVAFCGATRENVDDARERLSRTFGEARVRATVVDLSDSDKADGYFDEVLSDWGGVGVFIHSAGVSPKRDGARIPVHETELDGWRRVMRVNVEAAFLGARRLLPQMTSNGFGRVVFIGSIASRGVPKLAGAPYVASKAALSGLMRSIVGEYSAHGVTANCVAPGNIRTNMTQRLSADDVAAIERRVPLGRMGEADDVAGVVALLCSPEGRFINGATVDVNGGEVIAT